MDIGGDLTGHRCQGLPPDIPRQVKISPWWPSPQGEIAPGRGPFEASDGGRKIGGVHPRVRTLPDKGGVD